MVIMLVVDVQHLHKNILHMFWSKHGLQYERHKMNDKNILIDIMELRREWTMHFFIILSGTSVHWQPQTLFGYQYQTSGALYGLVENLLVLLSYL